MTTDTPEKVKKKKAPPYKGGAPIGNQNALGHGFGRPRKYDYAAEGKELYEWSKLPTSTAIYQFTRDKEYLADELDEFADRDVDFALYYKKAKENIGQNREEGCNIGTMNYGVWNRSASLYHTKLRKHEREEKAYEIEVKTKLEQQSKVNPEDEKRFNKLMKQVEGLQSSARKSDDNNKSKDK